MHKGVSRGWTAALLTALALSLASCGGAKKGQSIVGRLTEELAAEAMPAAADAETSKAPEAAVDTGETEDGTGLLSALASALEAESGEAVPAADPEEDGKEEEISGRDPGTEKEELEAAEEQQTVDLLAEVLQTAAGAEVSKVPEAAVNTDETKAGTGSESAAASVQEAENGEAVPTTDPEEDGKKEEVSDRDSGTEKEELEAAEGQQAVDFAVWIGEPTEPFLLQYPYVKPGDVFLKNRYYTYSDTSGDYTNVPEMDIKEYKGRIAYIRLSSSPSEYGICGANTRQGLEEIREILLDQGFSYVGLDVYDYTYRGSYWEEACYTKDDLYVLVESRRRETEDPASDLYVSAITGMTAGEFVRTCAGEEYVNEEDGTVTAVPEKPEEEFVLPDSFVPDDPYDIACALGKTKAWIWANIPDVWDLDVMKWMRVNGGAEDEKGSGLFLSYVDERIERVTMRGGMDGYTVFGLRCGTSLEWAEKLLGEHGFSRTAQGQEPGTGRHAIRYENDTYVLECVTTERFNSQGIDACDEGAVHAVNLYFSEGKKAATLRERIIGTWYRSGRNEGETVFNDDYTYVMPETGEGGTWRMEEEEIDFCFLKDGRAGVPEPVGFLGDSIVILEGKFYTGTPTYPANLYDSASKLYEPAEKSVDKRFVGSWYNLDGSDSDPVYMTFHADGTGIRTADQAETPFYWDTELEQFGTVVYPGNKNGDSYDLWAYDYIEGENGEDMIDLSGAIFKRVESTAASEQESAECPENAESTESLENGESTELQENKESREGEVKPKESVAREKEKEAAPQRSDAEILEGLGYRKPEAVTTERVIIKTADGMLSLKPLPAGLCLFDFRTDLDGDGRDEILAGTTGKSSGDAQYVRILLLEEENGAWMEAAALDTVLPLDELVAGSAYVFLNGREIFAEEWGNGIAATGWEYCLKRYSYDGKDFTDLSDPGTAYEGSGITDALTSLDPDSSEDEWTRQAVESFRSAVLSSGLSAPEGVGTVPLYRQNSGTLPLLGLHTYFTGDHAELWKWMSSGMNGEFSCGPCIIHGVHDGGAFPGDHSEYVLEDSSSRRLSDTEISELTSEEIQTAINEIYARHGYLFSTPEVLEYFQGRSWYAGSIPASEFDSSVFSAVERENIGRLQEARARRSGQ